MPVHQHNLVLQAGDTIVKAGPFSKIQGVPSALEYNYSMLYRATPPTWLSDACIRGLSDRLSAGFEHAYFGRLQTATPKPDVKAQTRRR